MTGKEFEAIIARHMQEMKIRDHMIIRMAHWLAASDEHPDPTKHIQKARKEVEELHRAIEVYRDRDR